MSYSLGELAVRFGCELRGDPELRVERVATLGAGGPGTLSFFANPRYRAQLAATRATAVVLEAGSAAQCPVAALISGNPYACYARMAALLHPAPRPAVGVHDSAVIDSTAQIGAGASIGAGTVVGPGVRVGAGCLIGPGCVLGEGVSVGEGGVLHARVTLEARVRIGARVRIQSGAVIGGDGFGFARDADGWIAVPQLGSVTIGDDVEIGANTTIDRGAIDDTVIADGVKLDNQIQIGHNVQIGAYTAIAACTGISGSTRIGARCIIAGGVGIGGHLEICDDVVFTGLTMVSHSVRQPGVYSSGIPMEPAAVWRRMVGRFKRLDALVERVTRLERSNNGTKAHE